MKDKRQDTENQLSQLRQFCESQGWTITGEYVDRASGKRSDREQFLKLYADASQRKFDTVLFWSLDRFSREGVRETLNHLERLTSYGVNYRSFTEQYLDSCGIFKDAVLAILAVIAKQERVRLSERTLAGLAKARKQGRVGGRPRLGASERPGSEIPGGGNVDFGDRSEDDGSQDISASDSEGDGGVTRDTGPTRAAIQCPSCGRCFILRAEMGDHPVEGQPKSAPKNVPVPALPPVRGITPRLLSLREAATYIGRESVRSVEWLVAQKAFPVIRAPGTRRVMVDRKDLDRWIEKGKE